MNIDRRALLGGLAAATATALAGCQPAAVPLRPFPDPSFAQNGFIRLDVNEIEVVTAYRAPGIAPYVEQRFPITPERMMQRWAQERLQPTGGTLRRGRFVIEDASVRENEIARSGGLRAAFTTQQAFLYEGSLRATLEVFSASGENRDGFATATVTRSQSVTENASVADREYAAGNLLSGLMASFDAEMERQIRAYLGPFLR